MIMQCRNKKTRRNAGYLGDYMGYSGKKWARVGYPLVCLGYTYYFFIRLCICESLMSKVNDYTRFILFISSACIHWG